MSPGVDFEHGPAVSVRLAAGPVEVAPSRSAALAPLATATLPFTAVVLIGANDGGYFDATWTWATVGLGAAAALAVLHRRDEPLGPLAWASLAALAGLVGWTFLSGTWGAAGTEASHEARRGVVYLVAYAAFLFAQRRSTRRAFVVGLTAGVVALPLYGLVERTLRPAGSDPFQGTLLFEPVGYANTLGIVSGIGMLLALGSIPGERRLAVKLLFASAALASTVALILTQSRGAWLAVAAGLLVLTLCHSTRARVLSRRRVLGLILALALATTAWIAVAAPTPALGDRPAYWQVAVDGALRHPVLGSGAGSFDDVWLERRTIPANVRDAHSLYAETAAELGGVGLLLLLGVVGPPLVAAARVAGRRVEAAAAAAWVAFLVHAGLDWDWEMPVAVIAGLACSAVLLGTVRAKPRRPSPA